MAMEWAIDTAGPLTLDETPVHEFGTTVDWSKEMSNQLVDWSTLDFSQNVHPTAPFEPHCL
jgi:hypothetical protein